MATYGLSINDNDDVASFYRRLPRRFADAGPAVVLIDHVTKTREGRGRHAIGAQHKLAAIDGASYIIESVTPFAPARFGLSRLLIAKDRPGRIREHLDGKTVAELHLHSEPGHITASLRPPEAKEQ